MKKQTVIKKKTKPRATSVAAIKLGGEPQLLLPSDIELVKALNWYNAVATDSDQRVRWVLQFMEDQGHYTPAEIAEFKRRGKKFLGTFSALARIISNGSTLDDRYTRTLNEEIAKYVGKANTVSDDDLAFDEEGQVVQVQATKKPKSDKTNLIANQLVEVIDGCMDRVLSGEKLSSIYELLVNKGITAAVAKELKTFYKPQAFEFFELHAGKDEQLNEGYARFNKKTRRAIRDWMMQLIADLTTLEKNKKVTRKPRKKRVQKTENLVKRMKFCKESSTFKLRSIDPTSVVGAKLLWVFNTKTRQIGAYHAKDDSGITVKGTTLQNCSGKMKKLRNPEMFLASFSGTKMSLETKYKSVNAVEAEMNGRVNEHIILMRAF